MGTTTLGAPVTGTVGGPLVGVWVGVPKGAAVVGPLVGDVVGRRVVVVGVRVRVGF